MTTQGGTGFLENVWGKEQEVGVNWTWIWILVLPLFSSWTWESCLSLWLEYFIVSFHNFIRGHNRSHFGVSPWWWTIIALLGLMYINLLCVCMLSHSVVSDSWRSHGLSPARLLCPWGSPGRNTGVGCHALFKGSSQPRDQNQVSSLQADSLLSEPQGSPNWWYHV